MNLEQCIVREIEKSKSISFARFMELALYAPELGYYEHKERVGRAGDFFTSVSVGSLFGELLSYQFAEWLGDDSSGSSPQILESGAHDGQLACDILLRLQRGAPDFFQKVRYCILEPSIRHEQWQRETLKQFSNVRWVKEWTEVEPFSGIIFSNELLDAIPFHRIQWNALARKWQEMNVEWTGNQFVWTLNAISSDFPQLPTVPEPLADVLPDGFQTEVGPSALAWWKIAAGKLKRGKIMAIDYGLTADEFFTPERSRGTARSYKRHHLGHDLLSNPGEQDITCHVNFSAIMEAGESAGFQTEFFGSQSKFLTSIVEKNQRSGIDALDRKFVAQFQTLTHPAHLGARFKVLVQKANLLI
ncbi:MAG: SAM-dependent methyltransferase [Verrucomicrobia bacterium]|nr:SAM-dependent methyltransferase [Verrucomicrobiota bacterium]